MPRGHRYLVSTLDENGQELWNHVAFGSLYPKFVLEVKDAILMGYYSHKKEDWVYAAPIWIRRDFEVVPKSVVHDGELTLIMLKVVDSNLKDSYLFEYNQYA
jgi:hypothetical protein